MCLFFVFIFVFCTINKLCTFILVFCTINTNLYVLLAGEILWNVVRWWNTNLPRKHIDNFIHPVLRHKRCIIYVSNLYSTWSNLMFKKSHIEWGKTARGSLVLIQFTLLSSEDLSLEALPRALVVDCWKETTALYKGKYVPAVLRDFYLTSKYRYELRLKHIRNEAEIPLWNTYWYNFSSIHSTLIRTWIEESNAAVWQKMPSSTIHIPRVCIEHDIYVT